MNGTMTSKQLNMMKKSIEDYYKSWVRRHFKKGVRDARVFLGRDTIVIIGYEMLSFVVLSVINDEHSKMALEHSTRESINKNFPVLKENIELITGREIDRCFNDIDVDNNTACMTIILKKEGK